MGKDTENSEQTANEDSQKKEPISFDEVNTSLGSIIDSTTLLLKLKVLGLFAIYTWYFLFVIATWIMLVIYAWTTNIIFLKLFLTGFCTVNVYRAFEKYVNNVDEIKVDFKYFKNFMKLKKENDSNNKKNRKS